MGSSSPALRSRPQETLHDAPGVALDGDSALGALCPAARPEQHAVVARVSLGLIEGGEGGELLIEARGIELEAAALLCPQVDLVDDRLGEDGHLARHARVGVALEEADDLRGRDRVVDGGLDRVAGERADDQVWKDVLEAHKDLENLCAHDGRGCRR